MSRLLNERTTAALALEPKFEPVPADQVVEGAPQTGTAELGGVGEVEVGVWELTAGAMSDTEAEEVFVVIAGTASIEFVDSGETLTVGVGDVVQLHAGERTIWRVPDRIRKVYLAP